MKTVYYLIPFFVSVFLYTYLDWVVNGLLYEYGLQFSNEWYGTYSIAYFLLYQFTITLLTVASRSWRLLFFMEVFTLSNTQDIIYFLTWNGGFPSGEWTWMNLYGIIGTYTTSTQLMLSVIVLATAYLVVTRIKR
jgi:hypothetical protein